MSDGTLIPTYELPQNGHGTDFTVFRHDQMEELLHAIWTELDGLEEEDSVTITFRLRTPEEMEELHEDE